MHRTRIMPLHGESASEFSQNQIVKALRSAASPGALAEVRRVTEYEAYYLDRKNRLPCP